MSSTTTPTYKNTIRLPKTDFAMKANLNVLDAQMQKHFKEQNLYSKLRAKRKGQKKFVLHDGPPYANGHIHLGTALNKILKDIFSKGLSLLGYDSPLVLGWDCHGLPIEWKVEEDYKSKKISKDNLDPVAFRQECRSFAANWLEVQKSEFENLGVLADFDHPYVTMDFTTEALIHKSLTELAGMGYLYLGKKPVMWSVVEQTTLAEAEVEYIDKKSSAFYVGFPVVEANQKEAWLGSKVVIWTTTPWTIPANQALAYSDSITYGLYEVISVKEGSTVKAGEKLVLAAALQETVFNKALITEAKLLDEQQGLSGLVVAHPLSLAVTGPEAETTVPAQTSYRSKTPCLPASFVEATAGTGIVHIAPAYGLDDFHFCKQHNIEAKDIIYGSGVYKEDVALFAGEHIFKVAPKVEEALRSADCLVATEVINHSYPCSWRSKAPLVYRLTNQWFLSLSHKELRQTVLNLTRNINFFPKASENRLSSMIQQRPDWCLSRQRLWGVPLAMFMHKGTEQILVDEATNKNIFEAFEQEGSDAWFNGDPKRFLATHLNHEDYVALNDVVDVWFDSGCSHEYVLRGRADLADVADIYLEGSDQHRGWFQSSLITSAALRGTAPYKNLLTHGFVLDEKGQKMSKSLGNVISPLTVIEKHGLDILRLWAASSDYREDIKAGESIFAQQKDTYRKIRNTLRYMLGTLHHYKPGLEVAYEDLPDLERFMLHKLTVLHQGFIKCFTETFDLHNWFADFYRFIAVDLSAFYFDIRKDTLYCDKDSTKDYQGAMYAINLLFDFVVKWLAPFITNTAEEAYLARSDNGEGCLLLEVFMTPLATWINEDLSNKYQYLQEVRRKVFIKIEEARAQKLIGSSLECKVILTIGSEGALMLDELDLSSIFITSGVTVIQEGSGMDLIDVSVEKKEGAKCVRCWKMYSGLAEDSLCERCEEAVKPSLGLNK